MVSITIYDTNLKELPPFKNPQTLLSHLKTAEKHHFPRTEALNFPHELSKRNTSLIAIFSQPNTLIAYTLFTHGPAKTIHLHKICTVKTHQRQGYGRKLLEEVLGRLRKQGVCEKVSLWVDESREAARGLYLSCGFGERERVEGYYGVGRVGVRMEVESMPAFGVKRKRGWGVSGVRHLVGV